MAEWTNRDNYIITTDKEKVNIVVLHRYLSEEAYWSIGIPFEIVTKAIENSICFSILSPSKEFVGFARMITDQATFGYLADVFVIDQFKGQGLGKWLIQTIMDFPDFSRLRNWFLYTKDAHSLYERYGWTKLEMVDRAMVKRIPPEELYGP